MKRMRTKQYPILPFPLLYFKKFLLDEKRCNASLDLDRHIQLMPGTLFLMWLITQCIVTYPPKSYYYGHHTINHHLAWIIYVGLSPYGTFYLWPETSVTHEFRTSTTTKDKSKPISYHACEARKILWVHMNLREIIRYWDKKVGSCSLLLLTCTILLISNWSKVYHL